MIDAAHDLPVTRQAQLLELSRSAVYYRYRQRVLLQLQVDAASIQIVDFTISASDILTSEI